MSNTVGRFRELCRIQSRLMDAALSAQSAMTLVGQGHQSIGFEEMLHDQFAECAKALGYDLVKREQKQEAA
jgi:hypothetical protein